MYIKEIVKISAIILYFIVIKQYNIKSWLGGLEPPPSKLGRTVLNGLETAGVEEINIDDTN